MKPYLDCFLVILLRVLQVLDCVVEVLLICASLLCDALFKVAYLGVGRHTVRAG